MAGFEGMRPKKPLVVVNLVLTFEARTAVPSRRLALNIAKIRGILLVTGVGACTETARRISDLFGIV
jgi:hypothetical protein